MTIQQTTIPQLPRPSVPFIGTDVFPAYRSTEPIGKQDVGVPGQSIVDAAQASVIAQMISLVAQLNALQAGYASLIPLSQKGATNGVATLGPDGKVPAYQLSVGGTSFKGQWDASTNTPTLDNLVGVAGDMYIISADGDQDLGAGTQTFTAGSWLLYDGSAWQQNSASNTVVVVNGKAGVVVLTAADIAPAGNRQYVTQAILDALTNTGQAPNASNPYVTKNELSLLTGGTINIVNEFYSPTTQEITGRRSGQNTNPVMLSSMGMTNVQAQAKWPKTNALGISLGFTSGIDVNTMDYDTAVLTETFLRMQEEGYKTVHLPDNAKYQCLLPFGFLPVPIKNKLANTTNDAYGFTMEMNRATFINRSGAAKAMFRRVPSSKSEADQAVGDGPYVEHSIVMRNFAIYGANLPVGSNDTGILLGATFHALIENAIIVSCDYSLDLAMCLGSTVRNVRSTYAKSIGFRTRGIAGWTGAGLGDSVSQLEFNNCRAFCAEGSIGFRSDGSDLMRYIRPQIEGDNPTYGIVIDNNAGVNNKSYRIEDLRIETKCTSAGVRLRGGQNARFIVDGGYNAAKSETEWTDTLFEYVKADDSYPKFFINHFGNDAGANWKQRYIIETGGNGALFYYNGVEMLGNPVTAADVVNTSSFPNIWDPAHSVPLSTRVKHNILY